MARDGVKDGFKKEGGDDRRDSKEKEHSLQLWRRLLASARHEALAQVDAAMRRMAEGHQGIRVFDLFELAQFRAQMLNGVACPSDFGNGLFNTSMRA